MPPASVTRAGLSQVCTACNDVVIKTLIEAKLHPLLGCIVCRKCYQTYGSGNFSELWDDGVDEYGDDNYCRWCCDGGDLFGCMREGPEENDRCHYSFCRECISRNVPSDPILQHSSENSTFRWHCYWCDSEKLTKHRQDSLTFMENLKAKEQAINNSKKPKSSIPQPTGAAKQAATKDTNIAKVNNNTKESTPKVQEEPATTKEPAAKLAAKVTSPHKAIPSMPLIKLGPSKEPESTTTSNSTTKPAVQQDSASNSAPKDGGPPAKILRSTPINKPGQNKDAQSSTPQQATLTNKTPDKPTAAPVSKPTPKEAQSPKPTTKEVQSTKPTPKEVQTVKPTPKEVQSPKPTPSTPLIKLGAPQGLVPNKAPQIPPKPLPEPCSTTQTANNKTTVTHSGPVVKTSAQTKSVKPSISSSVRIERPQKPRSVSHINMEELKRRLCVYRKTKDLCVEEIHCKFNNIVDMLDASASRKLIDIELESIRKPLQDFDNMLRDLQLQTTRLEP